MARKKGKKGLLRKARKRGKIPARKTARKPVYLSDEMRQSTSYEEVLLNSIISKGRPNEIPECALIFNSVLSGLTPAMRNLHYKSGISAGRLLYRIYQRERRYTWYEESVADLVRFFENAGFSRVSYSIMPERISIKFHNCDRSNLGANLHTFEAGMVSGFLTAGKAQQVQMAEVSCSSNGSEFCHFASELPSAQQKIRETALLEGLAERVKAEAESGKDGRQHFSEEYYLLGSASLTKSEYASEMNKIIYYMGGMIGSSLGLNTAKLRRSGKKLERLFSLLNLCSMKVKGTSPLACEMQFNSLKAKKEFVDISISFLNGLLKGYATESKTIHSSIAKRNGRYIVRVTEGNKKGDYKNKG
jgi:predicted hydrocarbon binding protein